MSVSRIKLIGEGHYHIYSRLVLGEFLLADKKEICTVNSARKHEIKGDSRAQGRRNRAGRAVFKVQKSPFLLARPHKPKIMGIGCYRPCP